MTVAAAAAAAAVAMQARAFYSDSATSAIGKTRGGQRRLPICLSTRRYAATSSTFEQVLNFYAVRSAHDAATAFLKRPICRTLGQFHPATRNYIKNTAPIATSFWPFEENGPASYIRRSQHPFNLPFIIGMRVFVSKSVYGNAPRPRKITVSRNYDFY